MTGGADPDGGTYTLVLELSERRALEVGALGERTFPAGWYAYTGSAVGSGGFARVRRHADIAAGRRGTRHWHVDYLLGEPASDLDAVTRSRGLDAECEVAEALRRRTDSGVPDFGASDCGCQSHLVHGRRRDRLLVAIEAAHEGARERSAPPR